ncbi:DUF444 family protein [bacterium]|nr:DUF444 family protein [bacterium]
MALKIHSDHNRFKEIIRGKIKQNLKQYIAKGEMIGRKGKDMISIPIPKINIPRFIHDPNQQQGQGQGEGQGKAGSSGQQGGQKQKGQGQKAGETAGEHILEVDISIDELAQILSEELELPNIDEKGAKKRIETLKHNYASINKNGPNSLKHFKRTYKEALKRQIAAGTYEKNSPLIVPIKEDFRYKSWKEKVIPSTNALIIYIMDVSGSMGQDQKDIVRTESFWIDTWLGTQYKDLEKKYIIHDAKAKEVDEHTFYHTRESGGTIISSAYNLCEQLILQDYSPFEWNIYVFHFSDGDNWSSEDTQKCMDKLKQSLLPMVNLFCYGQVDSQYGSGQFIKDLRQIKDFDNLLSSQIPNKDAIMKSIKTFLGKGK